MPTSSIQFTEALSPEYAEILSPAAKSFLTELSRRFEPRRQELLAARQTAGNDCTRENCPISCPKRGRFGNRNGP